MIGRSILVLLLVCLPASAALAEDGGSRSIFAYGAGNRALGMGGAFAAIADDASASLWNPGGLGLVPRKQFLATRTSLYGLDMNEEFVGLVLPSWRFGALAATFRHFGVSGIDGRDDRNFSTDALSNNETQITLAYGRRWSPAWSLGAAVKLQSQSLADRSAAGIGLDLGVLTFPGILMGTPEDWGERLAVGASVRNLVQPSLNLDQETVSDPTGTRIGLSYRHPFGDRHLVTAIDIETTKGMSPNIHAGLELRLHPLLSLRTGYSQGGLTAGTAIQWQALTVDYAFENNGLGSLHRFGLSVGFGATVTESRAAALRAEEEAIAERLNAAFADRQMERSRELMAQARTACREGRYEESEELLAVVAVLDPDQPGRLELETHCFMMKARAAEKAAQFADALLAYGEVLARDPGNADAVQGRERCRAESHRRSHRNESIEKLFTEGLDAFAGGDLIAAEAKFVEILREQPDSEASEMLKRIRRAVDNRVNELVEQSRRFREAGIYSEAEAVLVQANRLRRNSPQVGKAREELARALDKNRNRPRHEVSDTPSSRTRTLTADQREELAEMYKNGISAAKEGRSDDAIRYWEWAFSMDPDYQQLREYLKREYVLKGMDAFSEGQLSEAVASWESALRVDPEDKKARVYLSRARQHLSRSAEISGSTTGQ